MQRELRPEDLWVGQALRRTLIHDPSMQMAGTPHVFLWHVEGRTMDTFEPSIVRPHLQPKNDAAVREKSVKAYVEWRSQHGEKWFTETLAYYHARLTKEWRLDGSLANPLLSPIERHRLRLQRKGLDYAGTHKATDSSRRVAWCFACGNGLDSALNDECAGCSWIVCTCGACGCLR
jgi:hypothetical protein